MTDTDDTVERAKELFVYGPLGLALFLRDSAPQFMRLFVARGRTELQQRQRSMSVQIDQVRTLGENVASESGPEVLRAVATAIETLRVKAEEVLTVLGVQANGEEESPEPRITGVPSPAGGVTAAPAVNDLAIPRYVELTAAQVVDHLDGLSRADLDAIRDYEAAHRARRTILGKIEQLTRGT